MSPAYLLAIRRAAHTFVAYCQTDHLAEDGSGQSDTGLGVAVDTEQPRLVNLLPAAGSGEPGYDNPAKIASSDGKTSYTFNLNLPKSDDYGHPVGLDDTPN